MEHWHIIDFEFDCMEVGTFWTSNFILKEWKNNLLLLLFEFLLLDLWLNYKFRYMGVDSRLFRLSLIKQVVRVIIKQFINKLFVSILTWPIN